VAAAQVRVLHQRAEQVPPHRADERRIQPVLLLERRQHARGERIDDALRLPGGELAPLAVAAGIVPLQPDGELLCGAGAGRLPRGVRARGGGLIPARHPLHGHGQVQLRGLAAAGEPADAPQPPRHVAPLEVVDRRKVGRRGGGWVVLR
jgi:hypothetical protein